MGLLTENLVWQNKAYKNFSQEKVCEIMIGAQNSKRQIPEDDWDVTEKNFICACMYTYNLKIQQDLLIFGQKIGFVMAKFFVLNSTFTF